MSSTVNVPKSIDILTMGYTAGATIAQAVFVKKGTTDGRVIVSAASTDKTIGVAIIPGANGTTKVIEDPIDVRHIGIAPITYADTIVLGDVLMSDASGFAVLATDTNRSIGIAMEDGVSGNIGSVLLNIGIRG